LLSNFVGDDYSLVELFWLALLLCVIAQVLLQTS